MTTATETDDQPAAAGSRLEAQVAAAGDGQGPWFRMFDVARIDEGSAFLGGPILFEVGEEFVLALRRGNDHLQARARVTRVDRGEPAGVEVELVGLGDGERAVLKKLAASAGE